MYSQEHSLFYPLCICTAVVLLIFISSLILQMLSCLCFCARISSDFDDLPSFISEYLVLFIFTQGETLDYLGIPGLHLAGSQGIIVIAICQALLMVTTLNSSPSPSADN